MPDALPHLYDIIFRGDILPGQNIQQVKLRLAQLFKVDSAKIDALFGGGAKPLKRNLEKPAAEKYILALRNAGADVQLAEAGKITSKPTRPSAVKKPKPQKTMQERLSEQDEAEAHAQVQVASPDQHQGTNDSSQITLAPVGTDVLKPEERSHVEPTVVDISNLSLRDPGGDLLDASEHTIITVVDIDTSELILDEAGADLLAEDEKERFEELELDLSAINLAPVGSDMGAIKRPAAPPPPDTSSIKLKE